MNNIHVNLTIVFDTLKERLLAQSLIANRLATLSTDKENFNISRIGLVQWSDPATNEASVFAKNGADYYRYTVVIECTYNAEDDYVTVQDDFIKLFANELNLFFNIQNIDAYITPVTITTDTTDTTDTTVTGETA